MKEACTQSVREVSVKKLVGRNRGPMFGKRNTTAATIFGLRVYINPAGRNTSGGHRVFYSWRADGPYYRWWYERTLKQWRGARICSFDFPLESLCTANWRVVPAALQMSLGHHYQ
jgi:hypothetical protein